MEAAAIDIPLLTELTIYVMKTTINVSLLTELEAGAHGKSAYVLSVRCDRAGITKLVIFLADEGFEISRHVAHS